jgi:hypothetical protein
LALAVAAGSKHAVLKCEPPCSPPPSAPHPAATSRSQNFLIRGPHIIPVLNPHACLDVMGEGGANTEVIAFRMADPVPDNQAFKLDNGYIVTRVTPPPPSPSRAERKHRPVPLPRTRRQGQGDVGPADAVAVGALGAGVVRGGCGLLCTSSVLACEMRFIIKIKDGEGFSVARGRRWR